jgi:RNA polymerase sigma factor (sigma-70 family)
MSRFRDIQLANECLHRAAYGDRQAQREVYGQIAGPMFALARRILRDRAGAEDAFQDSMLAVLRHLPEWRAEAPFGAWVRQITLRQCLMHLRSPWQRARRVLRGLADGAATDVDVQTQDALLAAASPTVDLPLAELLDLQRALDALPDVTRTVLWLHDAEGLTHEEIAAGFGRTASFSKSQLARGHALLRARLGDGESIAASQVPADLAPQGHLP